MQPLSSLSLASSFSTGEPLTSPEDTHTSAFTAQLPAPAGTYFHREEEDA